MTVPDGYTFVAPRGRDVARKLLASARAIDEDETTVRAVRDGYHVPDAVADHYNEHRDDEALELDAESRVVKDNDPFTFNPPNTDGTPWVESTVVEEEQTLAEGSTPITEADAQETEVHAADQTGVGFDTELAEGESEGSVEEPKGNASKDAWLEFASTQEGYHEEADGELGRDELREKYGSGE